MATLVDCMDGRHRAEPSPPAPREALMLAVWPCYFTRAPAAGGIK